MKHSMLLIALVLAGCSTTQRPPVASPADVAAAARPAELPDVSDQYDCPPKPARPGPSDGRPRVTEGQVGSAYSELEAAYDECVRRHQVVSRTYEKARQLSRAIPPEK